VTRSRLVPLALAVTLLLVVVAIAARGRPLGSGAGGHRGLPSAFWDYTYTSIVILVVPLLLAGLLAISYVRRKQGKQRSYWESMLRTLAVCAVLLLLELLVLPRLHFRRLPDSQEPPSVFGHGHSRASHPAAAGKGSVQFRWDELVILLGLLLVAGAVIFARLSRRDPRKAAEVAPEVLAAALDESIDDLRADPDLRRAIVAAYARMEGALAAAGVPRHVAEAPLEYLERVLLSLDISADAVGRLTDLFEWARFSHHEPEPSMRDDAVDALIAVRDELRASELIPA
jgi:Domain of unknown function (DUF4129)